MKQFSLLICLVLIVASGNTQVPGHSKGIALKAAVTDSSKKCD